MDVGLRRNQPLHRRIGAVEQKRLPINVGHNGARRLQQSSPSSKVPLAATTRGKDQTPLAGGQKSHPISNRAHRHHLRPIRHRRQIAKVPLTSPDQHVALRQSARRIKIEALVSRVHGRGEHLVGMRVVNHTKYRLTVQRQRNRNGILWDALEKLPGPVQRVDNPDPPVQQPLAVVVRLLGQPGILRECPKQGLAQRLVDLDVRLRDNFIAETPAAPGLTVGALLPAVARARLLVPLQDLTAPSGGFLRGLEFGS